MRKTLIYLSSFVISFMVIYSWYYYHNVQWLSNGYVANADTMTATLFMPHPYQPSLKKNIIYDAGMITVMNKARIKYTIGAMDAFKNVLHEQFSSGFYGAYSDTAIDKVSEEIAGKFPKHPPLSFQNIKPGEQLLFSYLFHNIEMPPSVLENGQGMKFKNKTVRSLRYDGNDSKSGIRFYVNKDKKRFALYIPVSKDEELFWYHADSLQSVAEAWYELKDFYMNENPYKTNEDFEALMPDIDLFLEKTYTAEEMKTFFSPELKDPKLIDDRLKFKTSTSGHLSGKKETVKKDLYEFGPSSFLCLKRKSASFPYLGIILHNPEFLVQTGK